MKSLRKRAILFLVLIPLLSFLLFQKKPTWQTTSGISMTMPYKVVTDGFETLLELEDTLDEVFKLSHQTFSTFNPDSQISLFNTIDPHIPFHISPEFYHCLETAQKIFEDSHGLFDPACHTYKIYPQAPPTTFADLEMLPHHQIQKKCPLALDLGGIAKGTTLDLLAKALETKGAQNYCIEWDGEFYAKGKHPEGRPWTIGVIHPFNAQNLLGTVTLHDEGLATSGDYYQYVVIDNTQSVSHIFDPKKQRYHPREKGSFAQVSVKAKTCEQADAYATACMLFSSQEQMQTWSSTQEDILEILCIQREENSSKHP